MVLAAALPALPVDREALRALLRTWLEIDVPSVALIDGHSAPMDYLCHSFFEQAPAGHEPAMGDAKAKRVRTRRDRRDHAGDCVVWANRGGGKTFLGALSTALDLVFKPGIEIRVLGGSLEQSARMHAHLRAIFARPELEALVDGKITDRRIKLSNGSKVELLAQSQASVRGTRVQKLRCDEVELFDPEVWEAAQLTTRSKVCGGLPVRGSIECFSTMHIPFGLMHRLVEECGIGTRTLFKWGVLDVLGACEPERLCRDDSGECPLLGVCDGKAKARPGNASGEGLGHLTIDDALSMQARVSRATWEAEMLCLRPRRTDAVLPEFDAARHVVERTPADEAGAAELTWVAGMDFGFRGLTVVLWACVDAQGVLWVVRERALAGAVLKTHVQALEDSDPRPAWVGIDPAGNATNDQTGVSAASVLRRAKLTVRDRRLPMHHGLDLIRARLAPADGGPIRLRVHARCRKLIESLERYHYPVDKPESMEPVKDGHDHAVDALRYLVGNLDQPYRSETSNYVSGESAAVRAPWD